MAPEQATPDDVVDEPTEEAAPVKRGQVLASFEARIVLHERTDDAEVEARPDVPTIDRLERIIADALYETLGYWPADSIVVTATKTDR